MKKTLLLFFVLFSLNMLISQNISVDNFGKIDEGVYRSSQPNKKEFKELEEFGIKEILNLRMHHSDDKKAKETSLKLNRIKVNAGDLTEEDLFEALKIIRNRKGDILIHCWHGSDRTGAVAAMYRIVYQNWSVEKALSELDKYGHHESYYKNIPRLIRSINIDKFKEKLLE